MSVTYTYTVSDEEDAAITAQRLTLAPEILDNAAFVAKTVREQLLTPVVKAFIEKRVQVMADAYRVATASKRAAADAALANDVPPKSP